MYAQLQAPVFCAVGKGWIQVAQVDGKLLVLSTANIARAFLESSDNPTQGGATDVPGLGCLPHGYNGDQACRWWFELVMTDSLPPLMIAFAPGVDAVSRDGAMSSFLNAVAKANP